MKPSGSYTEVNNASPAVKFIFIYFHEKATLAVFTPGHFFGILLTFSFNGRQQNSIPFQTV